MFAIKQTNNGSVSYDLPNRKLVWLQQGRRADFRCFKKDGKWRVIIGLVKHDCDTLHDCADVVLTEAATVVHGGDDGN